MSRLNLTESVLIYCYYRVFVCVWAHHINENEWERERVYFVSSTIEFIHTQNVFHTKTSHWLRSQVCETQKMPGFEKYFL